MLLDHPSLVFYHKSPSFVQKNQDEKHGSRMNEKDNFSIRATLGPPRPQTPWQGMIPCTLACGYGSTRKENKFPLLYEKNSLT